MYTKYENLDATQIAVGLGSTQLAMDLLEVILDPGKQYPITRCIIL